VNKDFQSVADGISGMMLFHRMSDEGCTELIEIVHLEWVIVSLFCLFLPKQPPSQLIGICDMCLWFIDLADKLLNCHKSAITKLGDCANRGQCYESEHICSLNAFQKLCFPFSAKLPVLLLPLRASRAASAAAFPGPSAS